MRLKTRVLIIIMASLLGLVVMGFFGLYTMKKGSSRFTGEGGLDLQKEIG